MSTLTAVPAQPVRAVSWSRLGWVAWRRYRLTLLVTAAVLVLMSAYLVVQGHSFRSALATAQACTPADSPACRLLFENLHNYNNNGFLITFLILLPGLIGGFAGAPVLSRELENGTFRYAWTQGAGRVRWALAMVLPGAVGVAVLTAAFGVVVTWYERPFVDSMVRSRLDGQSFSITGLAVVGWSVAGFALGVLAGLLLRRTIPALLVAFAAWFGLAFLAATVLRPRYLAPLTTTSLDLTGSATTLDQWWTKGGVRVGQEQLNTALQAAGLSGFSDSGGSVAASAPPGTTQQIDPIQYLLTHGFAQVTSYQPDSRYWTFQWIEFGWLAVLSAVLLGTAWWLLPRRSG